MMKPGSLVAPASSRRYKGAANLFPSNVADADFRRQVFQVSCRYSTRLLLFFRQPFARMGMGVPITASLSR